MAQRLRFFAEWFCEFPLWPQWDQDGDDFIREKEFSADLVERLRRWNEEYNEQPHGEPPHSYPPPRDWFVDFDARGRALADEVTAHLGPDYVVEYRPQLPGSRRRRRRLLVAALAVVLLLAVFAADWLQQRREYVHLVDRTSAAVRVYEVPSGEPGSQEAALRMKQVPVEFAKVEQVRVLPWHRDMRAFRTASIELGAASAKAAASWMENGPDDGQFAARKRFAMVKRLADATPAFTDQYWGTLFP